MSDVDLLVVNHESAHAAAAHLLGLEVVFVRADRHRLVDGLGATGVRFRTGDDRPAADKRLDEATFLLAAVLDFPGRAGWSDPDVSRVQELAGGDDEFTGEATQRALELIRSEPYACAFHALAEALWLDDDRALEGFVASMVVESALS